MHKSQFAEKLKRIPSFFLIAIVRIYQIFISPVYPSCCRFVPTCSVYAIEAFYRHGALKGLLFTSKRILHCNPFCEGGEDPVP